MSAPSGARATGRRRINRRANDNKPHNNKSASIAFVSYKMIKNAANGGGAAYGVWGGMDSGQNDGTEFGGSDANRLYARRFRRRQFRSHSSLHTLFLGVLHLFIVIVFFRPIVFTILIRDLDTYGLVFRHL